MATDKVHLRHCLLYEYQKNTKAEEACQNLCKVFGEDAVSVRQCYRWFARFAKGDFGLEDLPRQGRASEIDDTILSGILTENPTLTSSEVAEKLHCSKTTAWEHIQKLGFIQKSCQWVPHELSAKNLLDRVRICSSLLLRNSNEPFLSRLITGDEKWIRYNNQVRKRAYVQPGTSAPTLPKPDLHQKKLMLCLWWDIKGPVYYELLKPGQTITADRYIQQLVKLNEAITKKRPALANRKGIVFHQDNARPHVAMATQQKLIELNWEVLDHPPYSPDIAPSDYYLFRSLQNFLNEKKFTSDSQVSSALKDYFASKDESFYKQGIEKLPLRWQQVINNNGNYITD